MTTLLDSYQRPITYLRLSVTDRCNYRCFYCIPGEGPDWENREEFLDYAELVRLVRLFSELGVSQVRITGGEPLVRRGLPEFIATLHALPELRDMSLSTNAHLLAEQAQRLHQAGIKRVNISLDSLDPDRFREVTCNGELSAVLAGIDAALAVGMHPVKLNMVVMRGINDQEIPAMLDYAVAKGAQLRFIETMPVGRAGREGVRYHLPAEAILQRLRAYCGEQLIPVSETRGAGPARYYQIGNSPVRIGVISALSQHFCDTCNRVRLTARGDLVLCLGQEDRLSLRDPLRNGLDDAQIKQLILEAIARKPKAHDFTRDPGRVALRQMSALGG